MIVGYARVSSYGQDLNIQISHLEKYGCKKLFTEKYSGKSIEGRSELQTALSFVREGDSIVVTKLDRLARSVIDLGNIAFELEKKNVDLIVLHQNIDTSSPSGKLMFHMIGAFAEFERDLIRERCAEGISLAKKNGVKFGRKAKLTSEQIIAMRKDFTDGQLAKSIIADKYGISRASLYRLVKD